MRRTGDNRDYAVLTCGGRRLEVHPDVFTLLHFMLTDPARSGKIEIGVMAGNYANGAINGLGARSLTPEPAANEPLYAFSK